MFKHIKSLFLVAIFFGLLVPLTTEAQVVMLPCIFDPTCSTFEEGTAVLFIPGLQASRLYTAGTFFENKLWEPNRNEDVRKLFLNEQGHSINDGIYTRDVIDEAFGFNVYKKFTNFMDELVDDGIISTWEAAPYDWRYDIDHDLEGLITKLDDLAADNKVTIITHSNGGLVVKALLEKLEQDEDYLIDKIDKVIMVAAPQLGTPKAIASFLHGYDLDYAKGIVLDRITARGLAEYMPSAFNLLPASQYFEDVIDPVIEFDESVNNLAPFISLYGNSIDSSNELNHFLTGGGGQWNEPTSTDLITPNVLQSHFLNKAAINQNMLQEWTPPGEVEVIQIAGWGLDTVKAVKYIAKRSFFCRGFVSTFCKDGYILDSEPVFTTDGDKTVVIPSALAMEGEKYYVNLTEHNEEILNGLRRNREHADILEVEPFQRLVKNILIDTDELLDHITDVKPETGAENERLRVSVHSPVSLGVQDEEGNFTGLIQNPNPDSDLVLKEEQIPNSYYMEFGEGKYIGFGTGQQHTLLLEGTGNGTFTLKINEVAGDETTDTLVYEDVPVLTGSKASLSLKKIADASHLTLDLDADGEIDVSLAPGEQLTPVQLLDILNKHISSLNVKKGTKKSSASHIKNAKKFIEKNKMKPLSSQLNNIEKKIGKDKDISQENTDFVSQIINNIKQQLDI